MGDNFIRGLYYNRMVMMFLLDAKSDYNFR
jgi:hypothetical protein